MFPKSTLLAILCLLSLSTLNAQIVNTEKLRFADKENGWVGDVDLSLGLNRNKAGQTLRFGASTRIEYIRNQSKWMALGGYNLSQFNNIYDPEANLTKFRELGFGHLRYNWNFSERLTLEVFGQGQFDDIQDIRMRLLGGSGLRLQVLETDTTSLYWGALMMYEYEENTEDPQNETALTFYRAVRLSTYLSAAIKVKDYLTLNHVTYYQPNIMDFTDFRISSETKVSVKIMKNLSFDTFFLLIHDTRPALDTPPTMFTLKNGLGLNF